MTTATNGHVDQARLADVLAPTGFAPLLKEYCERSGRSYNAIAHDAGINASYVKRLAYEERAPSRVIVDALAHALRLDLANQWRLFNAAGYVPYPSNADSDFILQVVHRLSNPRFVKVLQTILDNWEAVE